MLDLLIPRYKVISPYPDMTRNVGDIVKIDMTKAQQWIDSHCAFFERFPLLFKKLEWWEDRKVIELPKYVKVTRHHGDAQGLYLEVPEWIIEEGYEPSFAVKNVSCYAYLPLTAYYVTPITEEEFTIHES